MSKLNDLKVIKIAKVLENYTAFGDDFLSPEEALIIVDEILFSDTEEELVLIDECPEVDDVPLEDEKVEFPPAE